MTKPLYFYNGTTFELVGPTTPQSPIAYQTSAPTAPATGDIWIDSDGDVDTYNRQLTRYYFVATAAQTTITGTDANGLTLAYVAGSEAVYVNGALQVRGQDYTATNGTSVVLSSGLAVNDVVEIFAYTAFTVANAYTKSETDGIAAAAAGLRMVVPTSVAVGSGSASVDANGKITFSGASSLNINGCFSSTYDNYRIIMTLQGSTADAGFYQRMLASGSAESSSNYYLGSTYVPMTGASGLLQTNAGSFWGFGGLETTTEYYNNYSFDFQSPFLTRGTWFNFAGMWVNNAGTLQSINGAGNLNTSTSYDGLQLYASTGNLQGGTIRIYGYKN